MKERILIIDDESAFVDICRFVLKDEPYIVDGARTLEKGAQLLRENKYFVVVIDLDLKQGTDGLAFLKQMREVDSLKNQKAILITGCEKIERTDPSVIYLKKSWRLDELRQDFLYSFKELLK